MSGTLEESGIVIGKMMSGIETKMTQLSDQSEEYKDLQYVVALLDIIYGSTDLVGSGFEARDRDLNAVRNSINKLEVMA